MADEWAGRSLQSVLENNGYAVVRCAGARRARELALGGRPDAVIVSESLPEIDAAEFVRELRDDPGFDHSTPLLVIAHAPVPADARAKTLSAGVWEFFNHPLDVESLLLKLRTFVRAKRESADRPTAFVDRATGLYSREALQEWARHMASRARRDHEPFACVAIAPEVPGAAAGAGQQQEVSDALADFAGRWRAESRGSDVVGHLTNTRIAILAPVTNAAGALRLIERLQSVFDRATGESGERGQTVLRVGYCAFDDFAEVGMDEIELLRRAENALDQSEGRVTTDPTSDRLH